MTKIDWKDWIRKLQKTDITELCSYSLTDFIEGGRDVFLSQTVVEKLDQLKKMADMTEDRLFHLYVLAFVYRETNHFAEIAASVSSPLKSSENKAASDLSEDGKTTESLIDQIIDRIDSRAPKLLAARWANLNNDARAFMEKMRKIFVRYANSKRKKKAPKNGQIFQAVFEKERTSKCKIQELLRKEAIKNKTEFEALKRGYYRWKKNMEKTSVLSSEWPSDEFFKFCAFLSVRYVPENTGSNYYFLCEEPGLEVRQIYNALHEALKNNVHQYQLKREFEEALKVQDAKKQQEMLRRIAGKNYLPAIREYLSQISSYFSTKYLVRAAILGDSDSQKKLEWQAQGLYGLSLEVASQNRLRVADISDLASGDPIKPQTILRSIKFQINTNTDEWRKLRSGFKKYQSGPPEYFPFVIVPIKDPCWQTISMEATASNFNLLMKNVGSLKIDHIFICFSSRHSRGQGEKYVEIRRDYRASPSGQSSQKKEMIRR